MKLKYYLRGLGIGMMVTAIVLTLSLAGRGSRNLTDAEIREKARDLGMTDSKELLITREPTQETESTSSEE